MTSHAVAYQSTDLARRSREVVNSARSGHVLVRDKDGMLLSFGPAADLERARDLLGIVADWLRLESALRTPPESRPMASYGNLAWASALDEEDQVSFLRELEDALLIGLSGGPLDVLHDLLYDWRATAEIAADPDLAADLAEDLPALVKAVL